MTPWPSGCRFFGSTPSRTVVDRLLRTNWSGLGIRRFWRRIDLSEVRSVGNQSPGSGIFSVVMDGNLLYSSHRRPLLVPTLPLALAFIYEWERQRERLRPASMPLTCLIAKSIELDNVQRAACMQEILEYFQTDSVCFLENRYSSLFETQMHLWGPLRDSASHILGVRVETTEKLVSGNIQTERAAKCLQRYLEELDVWSCAAFHSITSWSKSAVIALNVQHGSISAEQAVRAARCVEDWQSHRYGFVEGEHDVDRAFLGVSIGAASILCRMAKIHPNTFARASDLLRSTHI